MKHSKTWPVSTLAVVQLRVDPNGRTYSTQMELEPDTLETETEQLKRLPEDAGSNGSIVLPLSQQHVEMFTRTQRHPYKTTVRTDTVSTILEHDFDLDTEGISKSIIEECKKREFQVLALARIEEGVNEAPDERALRRPSVKMDNWDLIYTEREAKKSLCPACSNRKPANDYNDRLLSDYDLPLDARKVTTLRRHYYPEGGWGWVIIACTVLVHILNVGLQLSCSQLAAPGAEKFKTLPVHIAGKF